MSDMERWKRRAPISGMSLEEIERRVKAGIKNRQERGLLPNPNVPRIATTAGGPTLTKQQRRVLIQASNLAIYSLANSDREDYCGAVDVILAVKREAGLSQDFMKAMCEGIAEQAAELMGEEFAMVNQVARTWLDEFYKPSGKVISIAKGKGNGIKQSGPDDSTQASPGGDNKP